MRRKDREVQNKTEVFDILNRFDNYDSVQFVSTVLQSY